MEQYIIPANSKKSILIMGMFRSIDLAILLTSGFITLILLFILGDTMTELVIKLLPVGIGVFLVFPVPYYHNVLVLLQEVYIFLTGVTKYYWRGWCASYEFSDDNDANK